MWKTWRRRSFAPRRPAVFAEEAGLVLVVAIALLVGLAVVVAVLVG